ncbi:MAG TPA: AI-2E family transporter [Gemmatimonadaceae bacterium]|nr:AI-2E family transporter [Gemmatimonadaceae bacterium]
MAAFSSRRSRAQLLIVVLGAAVVVALAPYVSGLMGAAILYVMWAPAYRRASAVMRPRVASAVVVVVAALVLLLPGVWLVNAIIAEAPATLQRLQDSAFLSSLAQLRIGDIDVGAQIAAAGGSFVSWLSGQAIGLFGSATLGALNLVIAFFGLYYLLLSAPAVWARVAPLLPFSHESTELLRERFGSVTDAMLLGTALTAVVQGAIIGAAFWLVGLSSPVFWGVVTAIASILPVLGSALVWVPGALVLLVGHRYGAALALVVIGAGLASNIDNVIRPIIYRRISDIHPLTTLVGAFAGVSLFGLVGLLLGPLAISYFFELLRIYEREYGQNTMPPALTNEMNRLDEPAPAPVSAADGG